MALDREERQEAVVTFHDLAFEVKLALTLELVSLMAVSHQAKPVFHERIIQPLGRNVRDSCDSLSQCVVPHIPVQCILGTQRLPTLHGREEALLRELWLATYWLCSFV